MRSDLTFLRSSTRHVVGSGIDKHLHGYSTLQFVTAISGTLLVAYDDQEFLLKAGDWFFPAHPGPRYRCQAQNARDSWHHRHIGFQGPLVESWKAAGIWPEEPQSAPSGCDWAARMENLISLVRKGERLARLRAINGLEAVLLELAEARQGSWGNPWLQSVLARLDSENPPGLPQLAHEMGLSPTALRRRFKATAGVSMQEHRLQSRLAAARALLTDTDMPLKAIAARLGYKNEFFFSRQFRNHVGVAPGAFRKSREWG